MDVSKLKAGDHHYMAYVGPPTQYDLWARRSFVCYVPLVSEQTTIYATLVVVHFALEGCFLAILMKAGIME